MLYLQYKDCKELYDVLQIRYINDKLDTNQIKVFEKIENYLNLIDDTCGRDRITREDREWMND